MKTVKWDIAKKSKKRELEYDSAMREVDENFRMDLKRGLVLSHGEN